MQREIFFGLIRFCEQVTMCIRFAAIAGAAASPFAASREKHTGRSEVADVCCPACGNVAARRLSVGAGMRKPRIAMTAMRLTQIPHYRANSNTEDVFQQ